MHSPQFLLLLLHVDQDFAQQAHAWACPCGGKLHRADYPRKPRDCPLDARAVHCTRLSFCCATCRKRVTPQSVRFFGRRVYLALTVVLVSATLGVEFGVTRHTLATWRHWWVQQFPCTDLWRVGCAQFMPPLPEAALPGRLDQRFDESARDLV